MSITVFSDATVIQTTAPYEVIGPVDVVVKDDVIVEVAKNGGDSYPHAKRIDATHKIIIPGMVCAHHHYYSGLSRGMLVNSGVQHDFIQILKEWWWRLDRALDEEALYYSSLICSLDAIVAGTTSCIDHHASPSFITGSLEVIAQGMRETGLRGCTCYEVTDRNRGIDEVKEGVAENISFAKAVDAQKKAGESPLVEAMIGGHAPFTIPNEGLEYIKEACDHTGRGMHLHVAEDRYDVVHSHHMYHQDILDRLDQYGLLSDNTLLVHGLHLNDHEIDLLNERGCFLAHNPRSNMNNNVGYCSQLQKVSKLVLGTDGCGGNMFEELKIAFFAHKERGGSWWPADFVSVHARGNLLLERYFSKRFGRIAPGYQADLTVLNYRGPTPLVEANVPAHIVWGVSSNAVESVMINGNLVMEHREFNLDVNEIYAKAAEVAKRVWAKVDTLLP